MPRTLSVIRPPLCPQALLPEKRYLYYPGNAQHSQQHQHL